MPQDLTKKVISATSPWQPTSWLFLCLPLAVLGLAAGILSWANHNSIARLAYVSGLAGWSVEDDAVAGDRAEFALLIPSSDGTGMIWMDQTRKMIEGGEIRLHNIDYENAPVGCEMHTPSLYRWWFSLVSWADHLYSGRNLPASMDSAAVNGGPILLLLVLSGGIAFSLWRFGPLSASLFAVYFALLFPLYTVYSPGIPDERHLALACAICSMLPLLPTHGTPGSKSGWFFLAGFAGGIGLWVSVPGQLPWLVGIGLGSMIAAVARRAREVWEAGAMIDQLPWGAWSMGGAMAIFLSCVCEYFPHRLGQMDLTTVHPLYGLAWLGCGQLLVLASNGIMGIEAKRGRKQLGVMTISLIATVALPLAMWKVGIFSILTSGNGTLGLTRLEDSVDAFSTPSWVIRDGLTPLVQATILPTSVAVLACWVLVRRIGDSRMRAAVGLAFGPVLTSFAMAMRELRWWSEFDVALSILVLATSAVVIGASRRWFVLAAVYGVFLVPLVPGVVQLCEKAERPVGRPLSEDEVSSWIERDIARWLRMREVSKDAIILAPSHATIAFHHFGGFKGLGTLERDNRKGFEAAVRIVNSATFDEAQDLVEKRGITYIVIPSWDQQLDFYSGEEKRASGSTFLEHVVSWNLPPWLQPVSYPMPSIAGDIVRSVSILKVVDEPDRATAYSRLAEYFVESERVQDAEVVARTLQHYPGNVGALATRAEVASARGDRNEFVRLADLIGPILSSPSGRGLPWDRRVSLAIVLAQAHQIEASRGEYMHCLSEMDSAKLRTLSVAQLYHLQVLGRILRLGIIDPNLRKLSLDLLPPAVRKRLAE